MVQLHDTYSPLHLMLGKKSRRGEDFLIHSYLVWTHRDSIYPLLLARLVPGSTEQILLLYMNVVDAHEDLYWMCR